MKDTDLSATSTFCEKSGPTWRSDKGTQHRIDYVLLPCSWIGRLHDAGTHYGVNLQVAERVDHFAVFVVVDIGCDNDVSLVTRKPGAHDLAAARDDPDKRVEFQRRIGEIPPVPSNFGPERHEQVLLKCLRLIAVDVFPLLVEKKRIPWMSNASWELVASKRPLLKKMKCMKHLLLHSLFCMTLLQVSCSDISSATDLLDVRRHVRAYSELLAVFRPLSEHVPWED